MTLPPILVPEANADVSAAYLWYEDQSPGLGLEFLRCVEVALLSIERTLRMHPVMYETYRRALVRRFPYAIFYEIDDADDRCIVYSIFHCSQDPKKWHGRLPR